MKPVSIVILAFVVLASLCHSYNVAVPQLQLQLKPGVGLVFAESNETLSNGTLNGTVVLLDVYELDLPCYSPAKVTFNFEYTHDSAIENISTVGRGLYKYDGSPTFLEFLVSEVDDYHFSVRLSYDSPMNQSVLIGVWSGSLAMQGLSYRAMGVSELVFHVHLSVIPQPSYPSEEEIAKQTILEVSKSLADYYNKIEELQKAQNSALLTSIIISVVSVSAAILCVCLTIFELRRFKQART